MPDQSSYIGIVFNDEDAGPHVLIVMAHARVSRFRAKVVCLLKKIAQFHKTLLTALPSPLKKKVSTPTGDLAVPPRTIRASLNRLPASTFCRHSIRRDASDAQQHIGARSSPCGQPAQRDSFRRPRIILLRR